LRKWDLRDLGQWEPPGTMGPTTQAGKCMHCMYVCMYKNILKTMLDSNWVLWCTLTKSDLLTKKRTLYRRAQREESDQEWPWGGGAGRGGEGAHPVGPTGPGRLGGPSGAPRCSFSCVPLVGRGPFILTPFFVDLKNAVGGIIWTGHPLE